MKIIFLDVDGVLNIMSNSYRTFMKPYGQHIEPHLVQRLNYLMEKTDARIVVSSSWKADMIDLEKQIVEQGFKYWDRVIDITPYGHNGMRGKQIEQWLNEYEHDEYVVLEDEPTDVCGSMCNVIPKENVIHVDMNEGLTHQNIVDAIDILFNVDLGIRDSIISRKRAEGLYKWQAEKYYYSLEKDEHLLRD